MDKLYESLGKKLHMLSQLTEAAAEKYVLALTSAKGVIGYYVSDDQDVVADSKKAMKFRTEAFALSACKLSNIKWDLERGQKFVVTPLSAAAKAIKEGKEYGGSIDFESDISDIEQHLKAIEAILDKEEFHDWIAATEENYPKANAGQNLEKVLKSVDDLKNNFDDFYDQIVDASS